METSQVVSIIVAIITSGCTLAGVIYSNKKQHALTVEQVNSRIAVIETKIDALEKKQDKHNTLIERMYECEKNIEVLEEKQTQTDRRLGEVERR